MSIYTKLICAFAFENVFIFLISLIIGFIFNIKLSLYCLCCQLTLILAQVTCLIFQKIEGE